jgi:hypothetical protein
MYIVLYSIYDDSDHRVAAAQASRFTVQRSSTVQVGLSRRPENLFRADVFGSMHCHAAALQHAARSSSERWKYEMRGRIGFTGPQPDFSKKETMSRAMSIFCYFHSVYLKDGFYCNLVTRYHSNHTVMSTRWK